MANDNIVFDDQGHARHFRIADGQAGSAGGTAQEAAKNFIHAHAAVLKIAPDAMRTLDVRAGLAPVDETESLVVGQFEIHPS